MRRDAPNPWPPFVLAFLIGLGAGGALGHWLSSRIANGARNDRAQPHAATDDHGDAMARRLASELQQALSRRLRR